MTELVDIMKSNSRMRSQLMQPTQPPADHPNALGDDMGIYFLSLAKTVKKLPPHEQVRLKMDIGNFVLVRAKIALV